MLTSLLFSLFIDFVFFEAEAFTRLAAYLQEKGNIQEYRALYNEHNSVNALLLEEEGKGEDIPPFDRDWAVEKEAESDAKLEV